MLLSLEAAQGFYLLHLLAVLRTLIFDGSHLNGQDVVSQCGFDLHCLMTSDAESPTTVCGGYCISSLGKHLFNSLARFFKSVFCCYCDFK